jgi:hypothetical protein
MNPIPETNAPRSITEPSLPDQPSGLSVIAGSAGSTLVDAALLIERIITHIDAHKDTPYLREQIALAAMGAHEIGPRLAKLAGIPWLPNSPLTDAQRSV